MFKNLTLKKNKFKVQKTATPLFEKHPQETLTRSEKWNQSCPNTRFRALLWRGVRAPLPKHHPATNPPALPGFLLDHSETQCHCEVEQSSATWSWQQPLALRVGGFLVGVWCTLMTFAGIFISERHRCVCFLCWVLLCWCDCVVCLSVSLTDSLSKRKEYASHSYVFTIRVYSEIQTHQGDKWQKFSQHIKIFSYIQTNFEQNMCLGFLLNQSQNILALLLYFFDLEFYLGWNFSLWFKANIYFFIVVPYITNCQNLRDLKERLNPSWFLDPSYALTCMCCLWWLSVKQHFQTARPRWWPSVRSCCWKAWLRANCTELQVAYCWGTSSFFPSSKFKGNYLPSRPPAGNCLLPSKEVISLHHGCLPRHAQLLTALPPYLSIPPQPVAFLVTTPGSLLSPPTSQACLWSPHPSNPTCTDGGKTAPRVLPPLILCQASWWGNGDGEQSGISPFFHNGITLSCRTSLVTLHTCGIMPISSCPCPFTPKGRETGEQSVREIFPFVGKGRSCTFR